MNQRQTTQVYVPLHDESPKIKKLLALRESEIEPKLAVGFQNLTEKEKSNDAKAIIDNDKAFTQSVEKYFHSKEPRKEPLKPDKSQVPPPPSVTPAASEVSLAAALEPPTKKIRKSSPRKGGTKKKSPQKKSGLKKTYKRPAHPGFKVSRS